MHNTRSRAAELVGALIVPTGIGASIGGDAGDATPVAKLLAACCDWLIVHPNVVNASDINEMPENALYVDGYTLDRFLLGAEGLKRCRSHNRILVVCNNPIDPLTANAVNAARHTLGADIIVCALRKPLLMVAAFDGSGRATGSVSGVDELVAQVKEYEFDVIALHTPIQCAMDVQKRYFRKGGVNPWGGVEDIVSRLVSRQLRVPVAHAPLEYNLEFNGEAALRDLHHQNVPSRMAAEAISNAYLHCVLKGLHDCPLPCKPAVADWTVMDLDFMILPNGVCPPDAETAIKNGTKLIQVFENKTVAAHGRAINAGSTHAENYLEAAGMVACMRAGVLPEFVKD